MSKIVRKPKETRVSKSKGTFNPEKAAAHIRKYMDEHDLNIDGMAVECQMDRRVISAIYNGKDKAYNMDTFGTITQRLGGIRDYWLGMTETQDADQRKLELKTAKDLIETEEAMLLAEEELNRLESEKNQLYKSIFNLFGYRYENIEQTAAVEFSPVIGLDSRPHILTSYQDKDSHELTDAQFTDLFHKMKESIAFACYQADRSKGQQATQQIKEGTQNGD